MGESMRAVVVSEFGEPAKLEIRDVAAPRPAAGQVRVLVRAAGINFRDVHMRRGSNASLAPPFTPGSDFAGEVVEAGEGVTAFAPGARVAGALSHGAYAEQVVAPARMLFPLPDDAS